MSKVVLFVFVLLVLASCAKKGPSPEDQTAKTEEATTKDTQQNTEVKEAVATKNNKTEATVSKTESTENELSMANFKEATLIEWSFFKSDEKKNIEDSKQIESILSALGDGPFTEEKIQSDGCLWILRL